MPIYSLFNGNNAQPLNKLSRKKGSIFWAKMQPSAGGGIELASCEMKVIKLGTRDYYSDNSFGL